MSWLADHLDLDDRWRDGDPVTWAEPADTGRPTTVVDPFEAVAVPAGDTTWFAASLATQGFEDDPSVDPITTAELDDAAPLAGLLGPADLIPEPDPAAAAPGEPVDDLVTVAEIPLESSADATIATDPDSDDPTPAPVAEPDLGDEPATEPGPPTFDPVADAITTAGPIEDDPDTGEWSTDEADPFDDLPELDG